MPRKPKTVSAPVAVPEYVDCPFTGERIRIVQNASSGKWQGFGEFYFTQPYDYKQELMFDLCRTNGKDPRFPRSPLEVVGEKEPVKQEVADELIESVNAVEKFMEEKAK